MSTSTYNLLKKHFMPELSMLSIFILQARILKLSHVTEVSYDCCLNMCCCFTGTYAVLNSCPFCKHTWYNSEGHLYKKLSGCIQDWEHMRHLGTCGAPTYLQGVTQGEWVLNA